MSPALYKLRTVPAPVTVNCGRSGPVYGKPATSTTRNTTACDDEDRA